MCQHFICCLSERKRNQKFYQIGKSLITHKLKVAGTSSFTQFKNVLTSKLCLLAAVRLRLAARYRPDLPVLQQRFHLHVQDVVKTSVDLVPSIAIHVCLHLDAEVWRDGGVRGLEGDASRLLVVFDVVACCVR